MYDMYKAFAMEIIRQIARPDQHRTSQPALTSAEGDMAQNRLLRLRRNEEKAKD